jgi:flagellar basal-body rod protein FlgB
MLLSSITDRGATPALVKTMAYAEARLDVIAENVANLHTPGYRAKQLDDDAFRAALREALDRRGGRASAPFVVEAGREVQTDSQGYLVITPSEQPVDHTLHHDGTNLSVEREMADLARTGMWHDLATTLLRDRMEGLRKAIRGQV